MKILADYDEQYLVQHVEEPLLTLSPKSKHRGGPWEMPPQMMRLISLLEEKFLGRWAYVKEYREVLRAVDFGMKNTLRQRTFKLSKEEKKKIHRMWSEAHEHFENMVWKWAQSGESPRELYGKASFAPSPFYSSDCSHTGASAYALFQRNRTVLVRAGVLRIRRSIRHHVGELFDRPMLECEHVLMGVSKKLLEMQVETVISQGALGGIVATTKLFGDRRLALAVVEDLELFKEYVEQQGGGRYLHPLVRLITTKNECLPDYIEQEA